MSSKKVNALLCQLSHRGGKGTFPKQNAKWGLNIWIIVRLNLSFLSFDKNRRSYTWSSWLVCRGMFLKSSYLAQISYLMLSPGSGLVCCSHSTYLKDTRKNVYWLQKLQKLIQSQILWIFPAGWFLIWHHDTSNILKQWVFDNQNWK